MDFIRDNKLIISAAVLVVMVIVGIFAWNSRGKEDTGIRTGESTGDVAYSDIILTREEFNYVDAESPKGTDDGLYIVGDYESGVTSLGYTVFLFKSVESREAQTGIVSDKDTVIKEGGAVVEFDGTTLRDIKEGLVEISKKRGE